ncbi:MAG: 5-dehydro-4-deoxy-D-glucuronate isomerase [Cyclobacteriaceae bacterium]|nr:5-dehydro-4-deoxy-D-glucuronate isomerase [Cyclobacteriaceae bacterium]
MSNVRYAIHPEHFKTLDTETIRKAFLLDTIFVPDRITHTYTHYDRLIVGGAHPATRDLKLETLPELKAGFFLERREIGIINVGASGVVVADGVSYPLENKDALYIGRSVKEVVFQKSAGALYYYNSAPAHHAYPTRKVTLAEADAVEAGAIETANQRTIRKLLINSVLPTCQLQMGLTELKTGSVWNTMPPHTHDRRMEAYFYFDVPQGQTVCHFLGEPQETRHIWVQNHQAVLSPPWSVHAGAGTSNYSFIWGMAGENLDYNDMDAVKPTELR